jgi:hypothetical protein
VQVIGFRRSESFDIPKVQRPTAQKEIFWQTKEAKYSPVKCNFYSPAILKTCAPLCHIWRASATHDIMLLRFSAVFLGPAQNLIQVGRP